MDYFEGIGVLPFPKYSIVVDYFQNLCFWKKNADYVKKTYRDWNYWIFWVE